MNHLLIFLKGFCMGAADVVPGVSGGTMALILGIYERLLKAIRDFDARLLTLVLRARIKDAIGHLDLALIVPLVLGIAAALGFFTRVVPLPRFITTHPELVYGLFFGLITASIWVLLSGLRPLRAGALIWLALGTALGLAIVNTVPTQTPDDAWFIFICGTVAISAMLLPGISGSFILLLLRKYAYVFDAIGRLDLSVIAPFAAGCVVGLMVFSRVIGWLLARHHRATLLCISGILIGSLWVIWPFQDRVFMLVRGKQRLLQSTPVFPESMNETVIGAAALAVAGVVIVAAIRWLALRQERRA